VEHERKRLRLPSPATVIACIALAVALGGTGYAAVTLPKGSVGTKQLEKNAVTGAKVKNRSLTAADLKKATLFGTSTVVTGVDFRGRSSTSTYEFTNGGSIRRTAGTDFFVAAPDLPQGAIVTKVTFYVVDNDATNIELAFTSYEPATGTGADYVYSSTSGLPSSAAVQAVETTLTVPAVVDRSTKGYYVMIAPTVSSTAQKIFGARVHYTLP
jgi:hypothetical protein